MRCFIFQFKSKPPSSLSLSITIVKAYPNNRFLNQYSEVVFTACQRVFVNKHMQRAKQRLSTSSPRHPRAALHKRLELQRLFVLRYLFPQSGRL